MSCRRPGLTFCHGDRGFCQCRSFPSRAHLEREIRDVETLLQELRAQLEEEFPDIIDDETDESEDDEEEVEDWTRDEAI